MDFAADFTAIDFETASRRPDSACQLGAVVVRNGRIVDKAMWMIRPEPNYFSRSNIQIHGITPEQVRHEPVFGDLWPEIDKKLGDDCLVAHCATFDIGVLQACLRSHRQPIGELHFTCTRAIARRVWPHQRRYGLQPLSEWLGIRFRHHDALEDSVACAKILIAAGIDQGAESLPDLEKRLRLSRGKAGEWGHRGPSGRKARRPKSGSPSGSPRDVRPSSLPFLFPGQVASTAASYRTASDSEPAIDLQRLFVRAEFIRPLSGKHVVFSGRLRSLSREQAEDLAIRLGGTCQRTVDDSTDYLVVGATKTGSTGDACLADQGRAQALYDAGKAIQIVDEKAFLGLVVTTATES